MKFTWGTGIFLFLVLFLAGAAVFIIFASRQQVNLVHKDYYEKGTDYSEKMKVDARSKPFIKSIDVESDMETFRVKINQELSTKIDSGTMHMYRPSDKTMDVIIQVNKNSSNVKFNKRDLINGRYILKFTWFSDGLKYEIERPVNVQ